MKELKEFKRVFGSPQYFNFETDIEGINKLGKEFLAEKKIFKRLDEMNI